MALNYRTVSLANHLFSFRDYSTPIQLCTVYANFTTGKISWLRAWIVGFSFVLIILVRPPCVREVRAWSACTLTCRCRITIWNGRSATLVSRDAVYRLRDHCKIKYSFFLVAISIRFVTVSLFPTISVDGVDRWADRVRKNFKSFTVSTEEHIFFSLCYYYHIDYFVLLQRLIDLLMIKY